MFGSFATGLYLPTSDIDLVVQWDMDAHTQPEMMQNALVSLEKQLLNKGIYADVKVIRTSVSWSVGRSVGHLAHVCLSVRPSVRPSVRV